MRYSIFVLCVLAAGAARAQAPEKNWKNLAEFSLVTTNGNSKTATTSAKNAFTYKFGQYTLDLLGGALGSQSKGEVTAEQYNASEKVSKKVSDRNYIYESFGWDKNRFAGILNRYDLSGGAGREILDFSADKLISELGAGYINEERTAQKRNDFASGRAYAKYTHVFSPAAHFSQDAEYLANLEDSVDYRFNAETAVTSSLSEHLSLKLSYLWKRVNKPAKGFTKDDTITAAALIVSF